MTVGLGTGSTAAHMVRALGERAEVEQLGLRCVATSDATAALARNVGLRLVDLDVAGGIDLTLDGADEIGPALTLIKGGGGALLREKLVWEASSRCVVIADSSKLVDRLGRFPLPVEVVAFGHGTTSRRLAAALGSAGAAATPELRLKNGEPVRTDGGRRDLRHRMRRHSRACRPGRHAEAGDGRCGARPVPRTGEAGAHCRAAGGAALIRLRRRRPFSDAPPASIWRWQGPSIGTDTRTPWPTTTTSS